MVTGEARAIVEGCNSTDQPLIDCVVSSAWIKCTDNISAFSEDEFTATSIGNLISSTVNGAAIKYSKLRTLELVGMRVPVMQTGTLVITVGTETVIFPTAFVNNPVVCTQIISEHTLGAIANVIALPSTTTEVTFRNRGTETVTIQWFAFDIQNLNN